MNDEEITRQNLEKYMTLIKTLDPELYDIKIAMLETSMNPLVILHVIRSLAIIANGTGYGEMIVYIQDGQIGVIKSSETVSVKEDILKEGK
jgi:hypothetical protein